jgi:RNA polymerase sigma factor (sigma-70 family)
MKQEKATYELISLNDKQAPVALYERYGRKLSGFAQKAWKLDEDSAWDLVYKTLDKIMTSAGNYQFESEQKFSSFVYKVFINYLRNHYRDTKSSVPEFVELNDRMAQEPSEGEKEMKVNTRLSLLNDELDKLEDWQRILLLMRSQDVPYANIATYVDKPESQLKVYYQRLKKALSDTLNEKLNQTSEQNARL